MMGDTVVYNTEHIRLQPNASVEDLLRRLPGLQVFPDGTITYNGERIQHLLVDGEDIFGGDPTLITRNFDAYKIARVEVLERKSDQARFTGVDDGLRTRTLNLVLKESEKSGYFGRVMIGGSPDGYYNSDGLFANLRNKEQLVGLGFAANTGVLGSGGRPGISGILFSNEASDPLGSSAGNGIPHLTAGALHYANAWNGPVDHLSANYQYGHFFTKPVTTTQTLQAQPDSTYLQFQQSQSINRQDQHSLYGVYDLVPDQSSAFRLEFRGTNSQGQNQFSATGKSAFNDSLINSSARTVRDEVSGDNVGGKLAWRIGIGRQLQRVFSISMGVTKTDNSTNGYLYSINSFYQPNGAIQSVDTVDQRKKVTSHSLNWIGAINYAQPLWKNASMGLAYVLNITNDKPVQATYNKGDGKYQEIVDSLSSCLATQLINQKATIVLQGKDNHFSYIMGNDWIIYSDRQRDQVTDSLVSLHGISWAPRVMLTYALNSATNVDLNFNCTTQQPDISQLETIKNNSDPLHITVGNPTLRPAVNQAFQLGFHQLRSWMINLSANLELVNNSISTKTTTDSLGRQITQPVNVDGGRNATFDLSVNKKVLGVDVGLHAEAAYLRAVNYVNTDLSRNASYKGGAGFSVNENVQDKLLFQLYTDFSYFDQTSSINTSGLVRYWSQNHMGSVTVLFIRNFLIATDANYTWQEKTSAFQTNTSILLWNGQVSRIFMNNKLVVQARLNNILDKTNGISRSNVNNINTEAVTNTLGRYWMLSIFYEFDKKAKRK